MGYAADEIIGKYYGVLFPAEDGNGDAPARTNWKRRARMASADDTRWLLRKNGERYWAEGTLTAIRDAKGAISGFAKVTRDATARRQMEAGAAGTRRAAESGFEGGPDRHLALGSCHQPGHIDESLRRLFGLRPDQEIRTIQDFFAVVHPDDREEVVAAFDRTLHEGIHLDTEFRVVWPDGSEHWLLDQGEVVDGTDGRPLIFRGLVSISRIGNGRSRPCLRMRSDSGCTQITCATMRFCRWMWKAGL